MSAHDYKSAQRPDPDQVIVDIASYAKDHSIDSRLAYDTARYCLMDTLACGFQALAYPACTRMLGPVVPGATMPGGARVPGTSYELDPVQGAFNIGAMIRWLDFNDTWLAAEWGHPSDNLIDSHSVPGKPGSEQAFPDPGGFRELERVRSDERLSGRTVGGIQKDNARTA